MRIECKEYDRTWRCNCIVLCMTGPTVKGEVAKQRRDHVKNEAQANADICDVLHSAFSRSKSHKEHRVKLIKGWLHSYI